jgi:hypothetical protein
MDTLPENDPIVAANREGLKLHLRVIDVGDYVYRVISLRPSFGVRYSTNFFHETWHIVTDEAGAKTLGRLFWGLSFQKAEGTLVLIDRPHLVTTPFDGDPGDLIAIAPRSTSTDTKRLYRLREALRRHPCSDGTVRFQTFGLPAFLERTWQERRRDYDILDPLFDLERMDRRAGMVCYTAPPEILRVHGSGIYATRPDEYGRYHYLDERRDGRHYPNGEVQVFTNFMDRVSAAAVVRRETLGDVKAKITDQEKLWEVQGRVYSAQHRRVKTRVRRARATAGA